MRKILVGLRLQFVWWGWSSWRSGFVRFNPEKTDLALIYRWSLCLGPVEVRRWA